MRSFRSVALPGILLLAATAPFVAQGAEMPSDDPPPGTFLPLREALRTALERNFGIRAEMLNPRISAEETNIAEATFDPALSANLSWRETESAQAASTLEGATQPRDENLSAGAAVSKQFSPGTEVRVGSNFNRRETNSVNALLDPDYGSEFGVELRQPLARDFGTGVNLAPVRLAESGLAESRIRYEGALGELFETVVAAYWEVAAARRRLELRQSSIELAETILRRTEEELELGLATRTDILQAKAELATREEARLASEKTLADSEDRLRFLLGEDLAAEAADLRTAPLPETEDNPGSLLPVLRAALAFDPERRAIEQQVDQRRLDLLLARDQTLPDLDLVLAGDYLGREDELGESYRRALDRDGHRWSAGVELSLPWGFAAEKARQRQATLRLRQAEVRLEEAEARVRRDVREAWRQLESGMAQLDSARATVQLRVEVLQAEEARRERGVSDISDVLEAARQLDDARLREVDAVLETVLARTTLYRLDGSIFSRAGFPLERLTGRPGAAETGTPRESES